jgi:hypothetical protein
MVVAATHADERSGGTLILRLAGGPEARAPMFFHAKSGGNRRSTAACRPLVPETSGERVPRQGRERGQRGALSISSEKKSPSLRSAGNDALSRPCRATLPRPAGEGTASAGASFGVFSSTFDRTLLTSRTCIPIKKCFVFLCVLSASVVNGLSFQSSWMKP